jgi:peptidyl-prolyl cis-trans isomerase B (cyclophilin B)
MKNLLLPVLIFLMAISACNTNKDNSTYALIETDHGNIKVLLYDDTPLHKENFIKLANEGFYDDLLFHRIIKGFMMQGGDPDSRDADPDRRLGGGGPGYQVPAEFGHLHYKGALAAARNGNPERKSSGSQFYIVQGRSVQSDILNAQERKFNFTYNEAQRAKYAEVGGAPGLDMDYTVFGEVVDGIEVIDKIAAVKTAPGDRPMEDVKMKISVVR